MVSNARLSEGRQNTSSQTAAAFRTTWCFDHRTRLVSNISIDPSTADLFSTPHSLFVAYEQTTARGDCTTLYIAPTCSLKLEGAPATGDCWSAAPLLLALLVASRCCNVLTSI